MANKYANEWPGNTQAGIPPEAAPADFGATQAAPASAPAPLQNYLMSMDDRQLDTLQSQGQLSPQIVNAIKAQRAPMMPANAPADPVQDAQNDSSASQLIDSVTAGTPASNIGPSPTQVSNMEMGPVAQDVVGGALQSAGMQPPSVPAPNMPQSPDFQQAMAAEAAAAEQGAAMTVNREAAAAQGAQKAQAAQAAKAQADADRMKTEAEAKDKALESQVKKDLDEVPNLGTMIGQALAIMMGAFSQGLSGAKENPGLVAIEKTLEREAQKRKYTQEQKDKQMEMALRQAQHQLELRKHSVSSMLDLRRVQAIEGDLKLKQLELQQKTAQNAMLGQVEFTPEQAASLRGEEGDKLRKRLVLKPNGNFAPISNPDAQKDVTEMINTTKAGLMTGAKLRQKIDYFGNNPLKKVFSRQEIAETKTLLTDLVGQMRIPYTGPGQYTEAEKESMRVAAGNPTAIFSLDTSNRAKLQTVMEKFKVQQRNTYRANGIQIPLTKNEIRMNEARQKYPRASETDIMNELIKRGKWDFNEE